MHEVASTGRVTFTAKEVFHVLAFPPLTPITILCPCFLRAMNPSAQAAPPALLPHCRLVLRQGPVAILIGVWGSLFPGRPCRTCHCSDHLTRRKSHCRGTQFCQGRSSGHGQTWNKAWWGSTVCLGCLLFWFTTLIILLYKQQRRYLKCPNVIILQRLMGVCSPAEPSAAHSAPWRLPSLLVGSDPLCLTPAPSPVPFTGAACPFMLKIALSRRGSAICCQGNTDVFVMLCVSGHLWCLLLRGGSGVSEMPSFLNSTYLFPSVVDFMFCPEERPACPSVPCDFILRLSTKECSPRGSSLCLCKNVRQLTN